MLQRGTASTLSFVALTVIGCTTSVISFSSPDFGASTVGAGGSVVASSTGGRPVTTVGSTGSESGGAAGTSAGSGGSAGSDADGGLRTDGAARDAQPDVDYGGICLSTAPDSGNACRDQCLCSECSIEAARCFANPACRSLVECASRARCVDAMCVASQCISELNEAGTPSIAAATALDACGSARCSAPCAGDARSDGPTGDAPAKDASTGPSPAWTACATDVDCISGVCGCNYGPPPKVCLPNEAYPRTCVPPEAGSASEVSAHFGNKSFESGVRERLGWTSLTTRFSFSPTF